MDENKENVSGTEKSETAEDYISAINELKNKTVDRSKYDALKAENKKLIESLVNGQEVSTAPTEKVDVDALRKELFTKDNQMTNLEFASKTLKLRDALIAKGEQDPFLPYGEKIVPTTEDNECAMRVANVLKECIDYANGDPNVFTNELQRRTVGK